MASLLLPLLLLLLDEGMLGLRGGKPKDGSRVVVAVLLLLDSASGPLDELG